MKQQFLKNNMRTLLVLLLITSFHSVANFDLAGNGFVTYPTGVQKTFDFGFKWDKQAKQFSIGDKSYTMDQVPDSYSIALTLAGDDQAVYVQEFAKGFISEFEWRIGPHLIKLEKKRFKWPVRGDYVLSVDESSYFLAASNASVKFVFNEKGIDYIIPVGITKDNGRKR